MFSAGDIGESQAVTVLFECEQSGSKAGGNQFGSSVRQFEVSGGFIRAGQIQEYTKARMDAEAASNGSDPQPHDLRIEGNDFRATRIMNMNDVSITGCHFELAHATANLAKTDIRGISTDLGFLSVADSNYAFGNLLVQGTAVMNSRWSWATKTSTDSSPTLDNIFGFTDDQMKVLEIVL